MNEESHVDYSQMSDKESEIINDPNFELTSEVSIEELQIITDMIKKKKIFEVEILSKFKFLTKNKFEKIKKRIEFDFGHTVDFVENGDEIELKVDGKIVATLDENTSQSMISNGMGDTRFVKATGIVKKETWEKKKVEKNIKKFIVAGAFVLVLILPVLSHSCKEASKEIGNLTGSDSMLDDNQNNAPVITQVQEASIDGTAIIQYFNNVFSTVASDIRMLEDQHLAYEEDLRVLQPDHVTDYSQISSEVQAGAAFLQEVHFFQQKYPVGTTFNAEQLQNYLDRARLLLETYHGFLVKTSDYCQQHLNSTAKRVSNGLLSSVDLNAEGVVTAQQHGEIETKVNAVDSALQNSPQFSSLIGLVERGEISFMEDGQVLYYAQDGKTIYYDSLESFVNHNANVLDEQIQRGR